MIKNSEVKEIETTTCREDMLYVSDLVREKMLRNSSRMLKNSGKFFQTTQETFPTMKKFHDRNFYQNYMFLFFL